jgi:hypothetical protein
MSDVSVCNRPEQTTTDIETHTCGMLRSSTKMTYFLPLGGPNTPCRGIQEERMEQQQGVGQFVMDLATHRTQPEALAQTMQPQSPA